MSLLGIDIGTTGAKVILLKEDGSISANVTEEYATSTPFPLWSEQTPDDWWSATCSAVTKALQASGKHNSEIKGVGVSGQMVGLVLLDSDGNPLRPCIMWNDQRSLKEAEELYPSAWIEDAFLEAVSHNKRSWRYIARILERWERDGRSDGEPGRYSEKAGYQKHLRR